MQKQASIFVTLLIVISLFAPLVFKNSPVWAQLVTPPITPPETQTPTATPDESATPTATPTSTPTATATPTGSATATPDGSGAPTPTTTGTGLSTPTTTPAETEKPERNRKPVITTRYIPVAYKGRDYEFTIKGYDRNETDFLTLEVNGLPDGIKEDDCDYEVIDGRKVAECTYKGQINDYGVYKIKAILKDDHGRKDQESMFIFAAPRFKFHKYNR